MLEVGKYKRSARTVV